MLRAGRNRSIYLLSLCLAALAVSMLSQIQSWILLLVSCAFMMRTALFFQWHKTLPKVRTLNLLALLCGLTLAWFSWQLGLLLAMVNLLLMASALKLMLLRNQRDFLQLVASQLFLTACGFIFQQSIGYSLFYALITALLLLSLALHYAPRSSWRTLTQNTTVMALQAIPIAVLLFLLMPKLGPLWQLPTQRGAESGLADKVTPGDIAQLSRSAKLAFRATFNGPMPQPQQRYWRAIVMEHFDGASWQVHPNRLLARRQYQRANAEFSPQVAGAAFDYQIIAEPTHQAYLFALDVAVPADSRSNRLIWQDHSYQLLSRAPLHSPLMYALRSYPEIPLNDTLVSLDKRLNLQRPTSGNPQTRQWVAQLRAANQQDLAFIHAIQQFFIQQNFVYTLQPQSMQGDPIDQFLFSRQAGFCAHYASAMAYALRLGGIPARMVTGYQGGEVDNDGYISLYQYDAHAWVEAWLGESGWQRFDPTALVAPNRLVYGLQGALSAEDSELLGEPLSLARLRAYPLFNQLRLLLADVDYIWSKWFLGFDQQLQQDMLRQLLGDLSTKRLLWLSMASLLTVAALLALYFVPRWQPDRRPIEVKTYQAALALLAKQGITRDAHMPAASFNAKVAKHHPGPAAATFSRLTALYSQVQYKTVSDTVFPTNNAVKAKALLRRLKKQLK